MQYTTSIIWLISWPISLYLSYLLSCWAVKKFKDRTDQ
jgi:hypothetical protein